MAGNALPDHDRRDDQPASDWRQDPDDPRPFRLASAAPADPKVAKAAVREALATLRAKPGYEHRARPKR